MKDSLAVSRISFPLTCPFKCGMCKGASQVAVVRGLSIRTSQKSKLKDQGMK